MKRAGPTLPGRNGRAEKTTAIQYRGGFVAGFGSWHPRAESANRAANLAAQLTELTTLWQLHLAVSSYSRAELKSRPLRWISLDRMSENISTVYES